MSVGSEIKRIRRAKRLSQGAFGALCGVRREAVSRWERDLDLPREDSFVRMQAGVKLTLQEILSVFSGREEVSVKPMPTAQDYLDARRGYRRS